ncbi:MAG: hypothetical protein AAFX87_25955 [Bacteroidota bacterium]
MSREYFISICLVVLVSCHSKNDISSYKVESGVAPIYLPMHVRDAYGSSYYQEYLESDGSLLNLEVYDYYDSSLKVGFKNDFENEQLIREQTIYYRNSEIDTLVTQIKWKNDTCMFNTDKLFPEVIVKNKLGLITYRSYRQSRFINPRYLIALSYDKIGRPSRLIELYDHGLDTDIIYNIFEYPDDQLIWQKRKVQRHRISYSTESLEETYTQRSEEILTFPENFDEVAETIEQTRIVEPIYE